ncbi:MAG TPA: hypothetical protein DD730_18680 [Desulfosporosinus sp.]|nr:hypothetical protein [Desulfosporosinus sp.]
MNILNLPEYKIISVHESDDAYRIEVETKEPPLFCTQCGCKSNLYKHTKRVQLIMDLLMHGKQVVAEALKISRSYVSRIEKKAIKLLIHQKKALSPDTPQDPL